MLMAEMGARIIKVEPPGKGDDAREYGPFRQGKSTYFASVNRGKQSLALDLKDAKGDRAVFDKLLAKADVLVENFRPGTMEKLGYGWETLHPRYPRLIYAAASGFGHTGPYSRHPAYDMVVPGLGGIMSITGYPGQPMPAAGWHVDRAISRRRALCGDRGQCRASPPSRVRSGEATKIDIGMLDCQIAAPGERGDARYTVLDEISPALGRAPSDHPTPFQALATRDGNIIIAAGNDGLYVKFCAAIGRDDLARDGDFANNESRQRNQPRLQDEARRRTLSRAARTTAEWIAILEPAGIPCGPINNIAQALAHPQVAARNMLITVEDKTSGTLTLAGNPLKFSAFADPPTRTPAPDLDADRAAILRESRV